MRFRTFLVTASVFLSLTIFYFLVLPKNANAASEDIEILIATHKWQQASRLIFREASIVNSKDLSIAKNLAKAGFVEDAIENAQLQFPAVRTPVFLDIAKNAPSLSLAKKNQLLEMAIENLKLNSGEGYLHSGDLVLLSFVLMEMEKEPKAKTIYEEAIAAASKGLNEKGSGGYRRISEQLATVDIKLVRDWMIFPLMKLVGSTPDPFNIAFTYLDLARLQYRLNQPEAAKRLLDLGMAAAEKIGNNASKVAAVDGLTRLAIETGQVEFAKRYGDSNRLLPSYIAFEAERGNRTAAIALVSRLQDGLYAGSKSEAQSSLVSNAVKRRDLNSAIFYAERLSNCPTYIEVKAWTQIAELQISDGQRKAAQASYFRAIDSMKEKREGEYYYFEVMATLELGKSMFRSGFMEDGHNVMSTAVKQMKNIPRRRIGDLVSIQAKIAMALGSSGRTSEATNLLSNAYREAHAFPQDGLFAQNTQGSLLSEIALVTAMMPAAKRK